MRLSLAELKLIIIDKISVVSNMGLLHIHQRLKEIFVTPNSQLFAGISVLVFGDFFQLPPIRRTTTFLNYKNDAFKLYPPWHVFKMAELTQIMRQKDDLAFTQLLNRVRTASHTDDDIRCIQSRTITPDDENYPSDALHIFAENAPVYEYNNDRLQQIQSPQYALEALDQFPPHVRKQDIDRVLSKERSETGGLDTKILIKENARVMLTTNVDISDRLINGQLETQLLTSVPNDDINSILNNFSAHRQDHNSDKFLSLTVCYKDTITPCNTDYFTSINGLRFLLNSSGRNTLSCLLLYLKHGSDIQQFIVCLDYIITSLDIDVIFGDFNIDYFNEKNISSLKVLAESLNYVQRKLVSKPTFVSSGSLLDHVYVKQSISNKIEANVVSVYYSDHEAVK
ncbi:ATP-dependent DNA helicase PIF1, partial [Paramuricea clavata]